MLRIFTYHIRYEFLLNFWRNKLMPKNKPFDFNLDITDITIISDLFLLNSGLVCAKYELKDKITKLLTSELPKYYLHDLILLNIGDISYIAAVDFLRVTVDGIYEVGFHYV